MHIQVWDVREVKGHVTIYEMQVLGPEKFSGKLHTLIEFTFGCSFLWLSFPVLTYKYIDA